MLKNSEVYISGMESNHLLVFLVLNEKNNNIKF